MLKLFKSLVLASLLLLGVQTLVAPQPAGALAKQQKVTCYKQWDGRSFRAPSYKGEGTFKKSNCYSGNKGNCSLSSSLGAPDENGQRARVHNVSCTNPNKSAGDIEDMTDPASDPSAACDTNHCPIIRKYINPLIALLSVLVGLVAVIAIIWGAILVTTSAGDPQKSAAGKNHIRNAIIGVIFYVFLYALLRFLVLGNELS